MTSNNCPLNELGHRFFVFKTFETYEPAQTVYADNIALKDLYSKVEYAILGCNCGQVIKRVVKSD